MDDTITKRKTIMSLERAREIVAHAEKEFANGSIIADAFMPFSRGGAATRMEALLALYLVIVDYYRLAYIRKLESPNVMKEFDKYVSLSGFIAQRIITDNINNQPQIQNTNEFRLLETVESFVEYIKILDPTEIDYWENVYQRIDPSTNKDRSAL